MARKLVVEIIGDARSLDRSYKSAEKSTKAFGRSIERAGRGATVATVGYKGLGRAVGAASGAFLGGAGLAYAIKSTISAAEESQRVLGQTQNAVEKSGLSWAQYGQRIQDAALATSRLSGFDDERLMQTFSTLVRRTGDVNRALQLNALAADVARGRNIELEQASQLVLRASLGQAGALRRVGIAAKQGASGYELIDMLQRKYAGSAAAYGKTAVGAQERFRNAVQNTQEAIGKVLLPVFTPLLDKAATWLDDTKHQEAITKDLTAAIKLETAGVKDLAAAIDLVHDAYGRIAKLPRIKATMADVIRQFPGGEVLIDLPKMAHDIREVGNALGFTRNKAESASSAFGGLAVNIEAVVGHIQEYISTFQESTNVLDTQHGAGAGGGAYATINRRPGSPGLTRGQRTAVALARAQAGGNRAAITAAVNARVAFVKDTIAFAQKLIRQHRGDTKTLADTLQSLYGELGSDEGILDRYAADDAAKAKARRDKRFAKQKKDAAAAKEATKKSLAFATERVKAINAAAVAQVKAINAFSDRVVAQQRAREQAKVFALLGLGPTGEERTPTQGNLQSALKKAQAAIAGTPVDTKAMQNRLSGLRDVINTEFGKLTRDTKIRVKEFLDALTGKDSNHPLTRGGAVGGHNLAVALARGMHLSAGELRRFEGNVNAAALTATPQSIIHLHIDGHEVTNVVTRRQQRNRFRTAHQTSGFRG